MKILSEESNFLCIFALKRKIDISVFHCVVIINPGLLFFSACVIQVP